MIRIFLLNTAFLLILALAAGVSAGDKHQHQHKHDMKHDKHHKAQNIIKVDEEGNKTALCACGMEFAVTEKTGKLEKDGKTYYLCSDGCKAKVSKSASTMLPALDVKVMAKKADMGTLGNVHTVSESGEMTAKCACGMDVKVSDKTVKREHNGQTYYMCNEGFKINRKIIFPRCLIPCNYSGYFVFEFRGYAF